MTEPDGQPPEATDDETTTPKKFRVTSKYALPSERIAWNKHFPLLVNAATRSGFGKQAIDSDVIEEGLSTQSAQLNVQFFVDVGLLTKTKRQYLPSDACVKFVRLHSLDQARAKQALFEVVSKTWFAETTRNQLSLKPTMTDVALMKELAIACEVTNFDAKVNSFRVLLEYLAYVELIVRDGDNVTLGSLALASVPGPSPNPVNVQFAAPIAPAAAAQPPPSVAPTAAPIVLNDWDVISTPLFELRVKKQPEAWALLNAVLPAYQGALKGSAAEKKD